jgi:hypothetical protein
VLKESKGNKTREFLIILTRIRNTLFPKTVPRKCRATTIAAPIQIAQTQIRRIPVQ